MIALFLMLGLAACDLTDSPHFEEESTDTEWLQIKKDLEGDNSLRILEMYIDKDDVNQPCPEPDCKSLIDEIYPLYQRKADSLCQTIYFGFQCCDVRGVVTVGNAMVVPNCEPQDTDLDIRKEVPRMKTVSLTK